MWLASLGSLLLGVNVVLDPQLVDVATARKLLADPATIVWDGREATAFAAGHLPGAVNIGDGYAAMVDPATDDLLPADAAAAVLGKAGIDPTKPILVYAARGSSRAYFMGFALHYFGVGRVSVLADGIDAWREADNQIEIGPGKPRQAVTANLVIHPELLIKVDAIERRLGDAEVQFIDARTPGEFSGREYSGWRGGHIPGAINIPFQAHWEDPGSEAVPGKSTDTRALALKSAAELAEIYAPLDKNRETIVYCQSGGRSAATYLILQQLGFRDLKLYDGSWHEYGNRFDLPAQNAHYLDPQEMRDTIEELEQRVKALEAARSARE